MKKGQRSLFDDIGAPAYPQPSRPPVMDDPFTVPIKVVDNFSKGMAKVKRKVKTPPAYIPPMIPGPGGKQIIYGVIPSKSNCYVIIKLKPKKDAPKKFETCPGCNGHGEIWHDTFNLRQNVKCGDCHGAGEIEVEQKGHYSLAKSAQLKRYEKDFIIQCNQYRNKMIEGDFHLEVDVYYPNRRSDLDNSLKVLLDCLQAVKAFKNDNRCTRIVANKGLDPENPRIEFELKPVQNALL